MKILQINASARSAGANSTRVADSITARLQAAHPGTLVEVRDLAANPHPVLDEPALSALFTPAEQRSPEQAARVALDDALIAQVQSADAIVLGVPMYNFGVPVQLKAGDPAPFDGMLLSEPRKQHEAKRIVACEARADVLEARLKDAPSPELVVVLVIGGVLLAGAAGAGGYAIGHGTK